MSAPRILAIASQKGGAGKTTCAVNLAAALAASGRRVLVIDLDPQGTASLWIGGPAEPSRELFDLLAGESRASLASLVRDTPWPNVRLVAGNPWLAGLERATAADVGSEAVLRRSLERSRDELAADWILLDTPPSLGLLALSALVAAHAVLVPVAAQALAISGLVNVLPLLERAQERLGAGALWAIVPCRVTRTTMAGEVVGRLRRTYGALVTTTVIRENVRVAESASWRQPVTEYAPDSTGATDYAALAKELQARRWPKQTVLQPRTTPR